MDATFAHPLSAAVMRWRRDDRYAALPVALVWVLVVLMIVPDGFDYSILSLDDLPTSAGMWSRLLWIALLGANVAVLVQRRALAAALLRQLNPFLAVFVLLALASLAWSIDPGLSARRLYRLLTITLACVAFVLVGWQARRLQEVLRPIVTLMLAGSLLFGLAYPEFAIHQQTSPELDGAWRGLTNHKNSLGGLACTAVLLWLHAVLAREVRLLPALAAAAIAAACLVLSRSATAMVATLFGVGFLLVAMRPAVKVSRALPALVVVLVAALLLYALGVLDLVPGSALLKAPIAALSSKDSTLTGRTEIWALMGEHIARRPLLGSGYAAYWVTAPGPHAESFEFVRRLGGFYPGTAHNGYLEVVNDLGWIGLACLLAYLLTHLRQSLRLLRQQPTQAILYLALFFQQALSNLTESHWFSVFSLDFVLLTLTTTALARSLLELRLRAAWGEPVPLGAVPMSAPGPQTRR